MGDTRGQTPHGFELLCLPQFALELSRLGNIANEQRSLVVPCRVASRHRALARENPLLAADERKLTPVVCWVDLAVRVCPSQPSEEVVPSLGRYAERYERLALDLRPWRLEHLRSSRVPRPNSPVGSQAYDPLPRPFDDGVDPAFVEACESLGDLQRDLLVGELLRALRDLPFETGIQTLEFVAN